MSGELIRGKLGGGVDRSTRLRYHDRSWALTAYLLKHVSDLVGQLLRLTGSGAVADGHEIHRVLRAQRGQSVYCLAPLVLWLVRIDNRSVEHLAGGIHHRALHAIAVARIQADGGALATAYAARRTSRRLVAKTFKAPSSAISFRRMRTSRPEEM